MAWFIGIILLLLLLSFPKQMIGGLLLIAGLSYYYMDKNNKQRAIEQKNLQIYISYNLKECNLEYPLHIRITNTGRKVVNLVSWKINAYRVGYSSNLLDNNNNYSTDKILKYYETYMSCYKVPNIKQKLDVSLLEYQISNKSVYFQ